MGRTIISVASTLYNLAGPEEDRPNYLKGTMFSAVISNRPSLTDSMLKSYMEGPGMKQRQFFRYALSHDLAGLPTAYITNSSPVDAALVASQIPADPSLTVNVQQSQVFQGDTLPFVEQWILENHQDRSEEDWIGDYNPETKKFSVQFPDGDFFEFENPQYDPAKKYIFARYLTTSPEIYGDWVVGTPTIVTEKRNISTWDVVSSAPAFVNVMFQRHKKTVVSYNDGTESTTTHEDIEEAGTLNRTNEVYEKKFVTGTVGYQINGENQRLTYIGSDSIISGYTRTEISSENMGASVVKTTTVTITGEQAHVQWSEQFDTQSVTDSAVVGGEKIFIYTVGSGNTVLDGLVVEVDASNLQEFYPFLPLRINNRSLRDQEYVDNGLYAQTKKAYRRSTSNKNIDEILDEVEENESIGDIDYAYLIYGVSLNVQENACRKYIYRFFEKLMAYQNASANSMSEFEDQVNGYEAAKAAVAAWDAQYGDGSSRPWDDVPPRPPVPHITVPPSTTVRLFTESTMMPSYDIRLEWCHIGVTTHSGKYQYTPVVGAVRDARIGEVYLKKGNTITWQEQQGFGGNLMFARLFQKEIQAIEIYFQVSNTSYKKMVVYGLHHYNYIYGGKSVHTTAWEALDDEDISGFVVPLHYPTMKSMNIVDYTQMATANAHILFNSYKVTKKKWWQVGIFRLLLVIVIIVVAVIISPSSFAAGGGILGGNAAIGAALGLSGTAALVAGVVANYLASIIISQMLSAVGTALFGEKWGALFAALASFTMSVALTGMSVFSAEGILGMGNVLANGYAGWVQGNILDIQDTLKSEETAYERQMRYIDGLLADLGNDLNFDPLSLTDSIYGNGYRSGGGSYLPETADEFIQRTTMVGSDVVDMTLSTVSDFVQIQQTLPRN